MGKRGFAITLIGIIAALSGCTSTQRIVGNSGVHAGDWYGELGITGHINTVTVKSGSRLDKLSILGDLNKVYVEDRVVLGKIEVWGENNEINVPKWLIVRDYRVGKGNKIIWRAPEGGTDPRTLETEVLERQPGTGAVRSETHTGGSVITMPPSNPPPATGNPSPPAGGGNSAPAVGPDGTMEILEVQPSAPRQSLPPGVHGSNTSPKSPNSPV